MLKHLLKFIKFLKAYPKIPPGQYCYFGSRAPNDEVYRSCPYWSVRKDWPKQADGYCSYLGWGDMDSNSDDSVIIARIKINQKTRKPKVVELIPAPEMPFGISLLWDQCKECGIKIEEKDNGE